MLMHQIASVGFAEITLAQIDALSQDEFDELPFGVIGLSADGLVEVYNTTESRLAGLSARSIMGAHFFQDIGQCMNNFMVAQRFEDEPELDATIDFVLTLRMRPTPVRLRMLQGRIARRHYILIWR